MCLSLYDYQSKASRYRKGLTYLKNRVTANQKHTIDSQKNKKKRMKDTTLKKAIKSQGKRIREEKRNREELQIQLQNN